ncbi:MAG: hypothetical protein JWP66_1725 [Naasia sp.]|nr:hypothetical protein [Naasia sp.]
MTALTTDFDPFTGRSALPVWAHSLAELEIMEEEARYAVAQRYRYVAEAWRLFAGKVGPAVALDTSSMPSRSFRAEIATILSIPEVTAQNVIGRARILLEHIPSTYLRFEAGKFTERHAQLLADAVADLGPDDTADLEQRALPYAETLTARKFERKLAVLKELVRPSEATTRHREAIKEREVYVAAERDGMAWLHAYLPSASIAGIDDYLDQIARSLNIDGDDRTHIQRRADVFADILLDGGVLLPKGAGLREPTKRPRGIVPTAHVLVPALTATGVGDEPAILDGFGPIDPETARQLLGCAPGMYRILTAPGTGVAVQFGRERYEVPKELRRFLQVRDGTCRFPGCNRRAVRCDLDHTKAWEHLGATESMNLAHLCRHHHRLKHGSDWKVAQEPKTAVLTWTSPSGRVTTTEPAIAPPGADPPPNTAGKWAEPDTEVPPF